MDEQALSKIAEFADVRPLSNCISSLTIRTSHTFVMPSQSAETILSPYKAKVRNKIRNSYPDIEFARVDCVVVAVESLHALASSDVPHCYCFITTATGKGLRVGKELNRVD